MSKLIDDIKVKPAKSPELVDPISLEELLLNNEKDFQEPSSTTDKEELQKSSRRSRRKRLKSSNAVNKRKSEKDSHLPSKRQKASNVERQERNKKQLVNRQKMSKQANQSGSKIKKEFVGSIRGSTKKSSAKPLFKATKVSRPVVLGTFGYDVITKGVYDSLHVKRSARRIKLDKQIPFDSKDNRMILPPIVEALQAYSTSYDSFFESIDPTRISMYTTALAALGINVIDGTSATEMLYTIIREYSRALTYTTARLDESSNRDIEPGVSLIPSKDRRSENLWAGLFQGYDPIVSIHFGDDSDIEVSLKCLTSILAKEFLFSYNIQKSNIKNKRPISVLQSAYDKDILSSPKPVASMKSAGGVLFKSVAAGEIVLNYPFEMTQIISDDFVLSAFDFVDKLAHNQGTTKFTSINESGEEEQLSSPYSAVSSSFTGINSYVTKIFDTSVMTSDNNTDLASVRFLADTLSWISVPAFDYARNKNSTLGIQLAALSESADNSELFDKLIIYLAFRQERLAGYEGGSSFLPIGPSTVLRNSARLQRILGTMTGKKTITVTSDPQDFTISPPAGSSTGTETFTQPERRTTLSLTQAQSDTAGTTLEDVFDTSYEKVADLFSDFLMRRLSTNSSAGISGAQFSNVERSDIQRLFRRTTTLRLLDELLNYEARASSIFDSTDDEISIFNSQGRSAFSDFKQESIFLAYVKLCSKLTHVICDSRATIYEPLTESPYSYTKPKEQTASTSTYEKQSSKEITYKSLVSSDFLSAVYSLKTYLSNDLSDTTDIIDVFPQIAALVQGVSQEERFLSTFSASLSQFFKKIDEDFNGIKSALSTEVGGRTLSDVIKDGTTPSRDMVKLLRTYPWSMNSDTSYYNGKRLRDNVTSRQGFRLMKQVLVESGDIFVPQKKQKIMCIGLPAGFIDRIRFEPSQIEEASAVASLSASSEKYFTVVVEKIDLTDPDVSYTKVKKTYCRELFPIGNAFIEVTPDFVTLPIAYNEAVEKYSTSVVHNHIADYSLKQYADLYLDLDFNELAFPASRVGKAKALEDTIKVPATLNIDKSTLQFASASNLAYDPKRRSIKDFSFYNDSEGSMSLSKLNTADNYQYSTFEFLNTYGNLFTLEKTLDQVNDGLTFERTICVPVNDNDFKVDLSDTNRKIAAETGNRLETQKNVGIGVETSEGIDMFTYRVTVELGGGK